MTLLTSSPALFFTASRFTALLAILLAAPPALADSQAPPDILKTDLMVVTAHPDDESMCAATIARYALGEGKVVTCVHCTRGEGGGNAVGTQLGPSLGELREAELRSCEQQLGVRYTYFLDKTDWAYTESALATLEHWGHQDTLGRLVRLIRNLRPDVVITMFPAPTGGQHGHHQVAGRVSTEAFDAAADPKMFPNQITKEGLHPWQVKRLYYTFDGPGSVGVDVSGKTADGRNFNDIAMKAEALHRSQGFDRFMGFFKPPAVQHLILVKSAVPGNPDDILSGLDQGLLASLQPETDRVAPGQVASLRLSITNAIVIDLPGFDLNITSPPGWTLAGVEPALREPPGPTLPRLAKGAFTTAEIRIQAPARPDLTPAKISVSITPLSQRQVITVADATLQPGLPLEATVISLPGIEEYRYWTRQYRIAEFADALPSWVPIAAGQAGKVQIRLTDSATETVRLTPEPPAGWSVTPATRSVPLQPGPSAVTAFTLTPPADAAVADVPMRFEAQSPSGAKAEVTATLQVTPFHAVPRVPYVPFGRSQALWAALPEIRIPHTNLVEGQEKDDADCSAVAQLGYDDRFLYVKVRVRDDVITTNIAPDDIKAHWRSDSVEICVDPHPRSESTLTTFKMGIFPWDTSHRVRAERDADANQGPIEETAPGTKLTSTRTDDGYSITTVIPWSAIGAKPSVGERLGFNIIVYDADDPHPRVGADLNKGRIAWSFRPGVWGRPAQWGEIQLQ